MLMRFYLGHAVGHKYTHSSHPSPTIETNGVIPESEDVELVLAPPDRGDGEESSSGSEEDLGSASVESEAMDVDEDEDESDEDNGMDTDE